MCFMMKVILIIMAASAVRCLSWNSSLSSCEYTRKRLTGTVYSTAVHYWPLKSSSSLIDIIKCKAAVDVYGVINTITPSNGLYGIYTDGSSGIKLASLSDACLRNVTLCNDGLSVSLWIKLKALVTSSTSSTIRVILASVNSAGENTGILIYDHYDHGLQVSIRKGSSNMTKAISVQRDVWHHVIITWTHYEGIVHYVNGKMFPSNETTVQSTLESSADQTADLYLSYSTTAGKANACYRDLAIWNHRLSEKQVQSIYHHTPGCQEISHREWKMTASSFSDHYTPNNGYFYSHSAWCADPKITTSYFQIELPDLYKVHSLVMQGKEDGTKEHVKTFKVTYSVNAVNWKTSQTLNGPDTANQQKIISFDNPSIIARYFRIYPLTSSGRRCLRVRLCGEKQVYLNITASVQHSSVNGQRSCTCSIQVNNQEYCPDKPGHNIVAVSHTTGELVGANSFDTKDSNSTGTSLIQFINSLPNGTLVIVAVKDSGHRILPNASTSLYNIGAKSTNPPPVKTAWILLGSKGFLQKFIEEKTASSENGLLVLQRMIPVDYGLQTSHYWHLRKTDYKTAHGNKDNPWYYLYFRDFVGGLDFYHRNGNIVPMMGTVRISRGSSFHSKRKADSCLIRPTQCSGGITVSLWLKAEHFELLGGEKDMPRYPLHKAFFRLYSRSNDGYFTVQRKTFSTSISTGHFVVLVDYTTGQIKAQDTFDVLNDATAEDRFTSFLNETPNGTIVMVTVKKSSRVTSPALIDTLKAVGAQNPAISSTDRYTLLGYKGLDRWDWIEEIKWSNGEIGLTKTIPLLGAWTSETEIDNTTAIAVFFGDHLQIQLPQSVLISGITTQGASSEVAWVKSYRIDYSIDGQSWISVKDGSVVTEFTGNTDQHSKVTHTFRRTFNARLLRIIPTSFKNKILTRISVLQINNAHPWLNHQPRPNELVIPVGPKALIFGDENYLRWLGPKSTRSTEYSALFAALHSAPTSVSKGCWCSDNNDGYLMIRLVEKILVTGIAIQGSPSSDEWTTKFQFAYKENGVIKYWKDDNGTRKNFVGNYDRHTVVFHQLKTLIYANNLRLFPKSWHQHTCLRFEVYGYPLRTACFGPLGVQDQLPNYRLSASSFHSTPYSAEKARIGLTNAAWCVALTTKPEYLQVDLGEPTIVTGIATEGLVGSFWTKRFYLAYSQDWLRWMNHTRDGDLRILDGNTDGTSVVVNPINPSIESRFIRVYPLEPSSGNGICLKIELFGCFKDNPMFALVGPLEINAPNSSDIRITGSYRYCPHAISCPECKRQIYVEVFDEVKCVVPAVLYDCKYHQFYVEYRVPSTPQIYNIRMFDDIGESCNSSMTRKVSGKIVGRVLVKSFSSTSCLDVLVKGNKKNGVYHIRSAPNTPAIPVYCDQMNNGGGWTVIQRRINGTVDFYRTWDEYKHGFGDLEGEFWIGNDNLHILTSKPVELLIEMEKFSGHYYYAKYDTFGIDNEQQKYKLHLSGYSGTAGDSFSFHDGVEFSTKDKNNDPIVSSKDCSVTFQSAWWYKKCKDVDLNGVYVATESGIVHRGIKWETLLGTKGNLKSVRMKIRQKEESLIKCSETECFYLLKDKVRNFYDSHKACVAMGAELASITSSNQTTTVADMISKAGVSNAYIGLNDRITEGSSVWADGTRSSYSNSWRTNNNGHKDCVVVCDFGQNWCAVHCSWAYTTLCKRSLMCYKGFCYKSVQSSATNDDAKITCDQHGMTLMKLATEEQIRYVTKNMMDETATTDVWTSLNDVNDEGKFRWYDQSHLTNPNWAGLEPKNQNGNEDCVTLTPNGKFVAVPCSQNAGQICQEPRVASSCLELLELGAKKNGVYYIHPDSNAEPVKLYCDQEQDGGGWEVFFRREDGSVTFHNKLWDDFKYGFGDLEKEFWLGLKQIARLASKEFMLKIKTSAGQTRYIHYSYFDVLAEGSKFEARIGWYRGGNLGGEIGRINHMRFSSIDQDNDRRVNVSCAETQGPGWLWTYIHYNRYGCFNNGYNLFGPYSPSTIGNETLNLFYAGVTHPIIYIEMKMRSTKGNARSIVATANPMDGYTWEGYSLLYIPHQFAFHLSTTTKEWFLAISPSAYWSYYTFSWSEQNGIRSYENALLVMQDKESRSVYPRYRSHFYLNIVEIFTSIQMFRFMTRMKAWNRDLTANQIKEDFKEAYFTLERDVSHWDKVDSDPSNWTVHSNCTKSTDTGPCRDHTYGLPQGSYYYMETSYPAKPLDKASLRSPVFFSKYHKCFSFWYYMHGEQIEDLVVEVETYSRTAYTLEVNTTEATKYKRSGNHGKRWKFAVLKLDSSDIFSLKITGIVGQGYKSDIAIDDMSVSMSECPTVLSKCEPRCKEGFVCLDDKGECDCKGLKHVDISCHDVLNGTIFREASHYWPLDGTSNVTNLLGFTHGTTSGSVRSIPGPVNHALVTDGSTAQIVLGDLITSCILTSPSCTNGFTFWFWLKFPKNEARERKVYLSLGHDQERSRGIQVLQDFSVMDNPAHLIINATIEGTSCVAAFEVHAFIWSVIAVTWGRTNGLTIYHNGKNVTKYQLHACSSVTSVFPSNRLLRTGHGGVSPALTIDDTVIWYRELAAAEITKIFRFFTAPQKTILLSVKFPDELFQERLEDRESQDFKDFHNKILENIQAMFNGKSINFDDIFINHLSNGSVNARLSLFFHAITSKELDILNNAVCHKQALDKMPIKLLSNTGTVFVTHSDIRQVTFCQNRPLIGRDYGYIVQSSSCNITSKPATVL